MARSKQNRRLKVTNCVNCSCKKVDIKNNPCRELHEMNDSKIKLGSRALADAELCDYKKIFPKILYSLWCVLKNIISLLCWVLFRQDELDKKLKEMCQAIECINSHLAKETQAKNDSAFDNVGFSMTSQGDNELGGATYTKIDTFNDGRFVVRWNEVYGGTEVGKGQLAGRVNHTYTRNDDGSITANVIGLQLTNIQYNASVTGGSSSARFTVRDKNSKVLLDKTYNPYQSFSENLTKKVGYNIPAKLAPKGSSGKIKVLETLDQWETNPTEGVIHVEYTNDNDALIDYNCSFTCDFKDTDTIYSENKQFIEGKRK